MDNDDFSKLSSDGLCDALQDKIHESALFTLREQRIDGAMFVKLTEDDLKDLFPQVGARLSVAMVLRERCSTVAKASGVHARNKDKVRGININSGTVIKVVSLLSVTSDYLIIICVQLVEISSYNKK